MPEAAFLVMPFPPTVNNLFVNNKRTGGRFPSKQYKAWREEAAFQLDAQRPLPVIEGKVDVTFRFGWPDKRRRDVFNYVKAPEDMLVMQGVIEDDSLIEHGTVLWDDGIVGVQVEISAHIEGTPA